MFSIDPDTARVCPHTSSPGIATSDNAHAQLLYTQDLDDALHVKEVDKGSVFIEKWPVLYCNYEFICCFVQVCMRWGCI